MMTITRHFILVGQRRVLYRRCGKGPPVVMLHGSPGNSEMMIAEMTGLAESFTCYALDTPGFGLSDALAGEKLTVADLADATARAICGIGIAPCAIYGTHTGAAIALELGSSRPDLVTGLVVDAVPIFNQSEIAELLEGYFAPLIIDPLAGHFTTTWMRFRDQHTWFPWTSRDVRKLNTIDRPTPDDIHKWVSMFYRSCGNYASAYRAATLYGDGAIRAAANLTCPATFLATADDMLFGHLDRLPLLRSHQQIIRLSSNPETKSDAISNALHRLPIATAPPLPPAFAFAGSDPERQFMDTPFGEVLVRSYGSEDAPTIFLLHDTPGSGWLLESLAVALKDHYRILVPDMPGSGESTLRGDLPVIETIVAAMVCIADRLGLSRYGIAGQGCGAFVARAAAHHGDQRISAIMLADLPRPDATIASRIAPEVEISPDGGHWLRIWLMVRDAQIYKPWFDGRVCAQLHTQGCFDGHWLHALTCEVMKASQTYHLLPRAVFASNSLPAPADAAMDVRKTDGCLCAEDIFSFFEAQANG